MIKFYTDAHIGKAIATQARKRGVDLIRCQDVDNDDKEDDFHLSYATDDDRTIVTSDRDFFRLHDEYQANQKLHSGIIYGQPEQMDNVGLIVSYLEFLHLAIESGAASLENDIYNQVLYIYE